MENRYLGSPDTVVMHVGTNDLRRMENLGYVLFEVFSLVATAESKFPKCSLVLSGVLRGRDVKWRRRDVKWRRIGAVKDR